MVADTKRVAIDGSGGGWLRDITVGWFGSNNQMAGSGGCSFVKEAMQTTIENINSQR